MALLETINMDSGSMAIEFPLDSTGPWTFVSTPTPFQGSLALQGPWNTAFTLGKRSITPSSNVYIKMALRFDVTTNPTTTMIDVGIMTLRTAADATLSYLEFTVSTAGVVTLRLINNVTFAVIGSYALPATATWYTIDYKHVAGTTGQLEIRVDGVSRIATASTNLGTSQVGMVHVNAQATLNGGAGSTYFDAILVDDAAYPSYVTILYEQTHYRWRQDNGTEVTAAPAAAEDTPL